MKHYMIRITFLFFFFTSWLKSFSQVNYQTGSATFALPVFNWEDDKSRLNSAISLNYNSGNGLKVSDVASNVGQGWNLLAAGVVSRMQIGEPDDQKPVGSNPENYQEFFKYPPGYLYNKVNPENGCPGALTRYPLFESKNTVYKEHNSVAADRELDRFVFQINGRTGSFILGKNNGDKCFLLEDAKMKVWFTRNEAMGTNQFDQGIRTTISAFYIQDENGLIYKFNKCELTKTLQVNFCDAGLNQSYSQPQFKSGRVYHQASFDNHNILNPWVINSWYLSEIKDPLTQRKIVYNYVMRNIEANSGTAITYYDDGDKNYAIITHNSSKTQTPVISSIVYPDGHQVVFNYGTNRADLNGDQALSSIDITYQGGYLSKYVLSTSYFVLNRITTPSTDFQKSCARLCLLSVKKIGVNLQGEEPPYIFDYYTGGNNPSIASADGGAAEDIVPPPFTPIKDIWGYYNGNNSRLYDNSAAVPIYTPIGSLSLNSLKGLCYMQSGISTVRLNAKDGYAKNGLLKRIIYPTGGSISYSYGQNEGLLNSTNTKLHGVHVSSTTVSDGGYSNDCITNPIVTHYSYKEDNNESSLWGIEAPVNSDVTTSYYKPEYKKYKFPAGCKWKFKYPGIQAREQAITLTGAQQFLLIFSQVADIVGNIMTVVDVINLCLAQTPLNIVCVVLDVIFAIFSIFSTCFSNPEKNTTTTVHFNADRNAINPLPLQFRKVTISEGGGGNGATEMEFTDPQDHPLGGFVTDPNNPIFSMKQRCVSFAYGLPKITTIKDANGNIVKQVENSYTFWEYRRGHMAPPKDYIIDEPSCKCLVKKTSSQRITNWDNAGEYNNPLSFVTNTNGNELKADIYPPAFGHAELNWTKERIYKINAPTEAPIENLTTYKYNHYSNYDDPDNKALFALGEIITQESNGQENHKIFKYTSDFNSGIFLSLNQNNIVSTPVSTINYLQVPGSNDIKLLGEDVTEFGLLPNGDIKPARKLEQRFKQPMTVQESGGAVWSYQGPGATTNPAYKETQSFTYDAGGNLIGLKDEGDRTVTNIYGYADKFIIASVVNAVPGIDKVAYTSFEDGSTGGWTITGTSNVVSTSATTGSKSLHLNGNNTLTASINPLKAYTVSFWTNGGYIPVSNGVLLKNTQSYNGYNYYEYFIPAGSSTVTISSSPAMNIDELRAFPQTARMRTVTYDPLLGKTSECDENNRINYFEYDELGRLRFIKDEYKNVVKMYEYNYARQKNECNTVYTNTAVSEVFYKNNCAEGYQALPYVYTVPAGIYTSTVSQDAVDQLVENDIEANGQTIANLNGTCVPVYKNSALSATFTKDNCPAGYVGTGITYTVPAGKYSSIVSQAEADEMAQDELDANGQDNANKSSSANCIIDTSPEWSSTGAAYCVVGTNGNYTGDVMMQFMDENPNSSTYNHVQWINTGTDNSNACTGAAKVNININNMTSTQVDIVFTNTSDLLNYLDISPFGAHTTYGANYYYVPAGTYNISISASSYNGANTLIGAYTFTYQVGNNAPVSVTGTNASDIPANADVNIVITEAVYYNKPVSQVFTKNDCPGGQSADPYTYIVPAGAYTSTNSQQEADDAAQANIQEYGQFSANLNSICNSSVSYYNIYVTNNSTTSYDHFSVFIDGIEHAFPPDGTSNVLVASLPEGEHTFNFPCGPVNDIVIGNYDMPQCGVDFTYNVTQNSTIRFKSYPHPVNLTSNTIPPTSFCCHGCNYTTTVYTRSATIGQGSKFYYDPETTQPVTEIWMLPYEGGPGGGYDLIYYLSGGVLTGATTPCP